jgi:hypothetical protein
MPSIQSNVYHYYVSILTSNVKNSKKGTPKAKKQTNFDDFKKGAHYCSTFSGLAFHHRIIILFSKIDFDAKLLCFEFLTKFHLNLKISTCYSSLMFYAKVLLHGTSFDPRSSLIRNMTLTIGIPSHTKKKGLFFSFIAYIKLKREKN